jgi:hypothetical protein
VLNPAYGSAPPSVAGKAAIRLGADLLPSPLLFRRGAIVERQSYGMITESQNLVTSEIGVLPNVTALAAPGGIARTRHARSSLGGRYADRGALARRWGCARSSADDAICPADTCALSSGGGTPRRGTRNRGCSGASVSILAAMGVRPRAKLFHPSPIIRLQAHRSPVPHTRQLIWLTPAPSKCL